MEEGGSEMRISHVEINNYRNIENISIDLGQTVVVVGENNSGKSNFLRAVTLPFLADEGGYSGKNLSWNDINNKAKEKYYSFLIANKEKIANGKITVEEFGEKLPFVSVEVEFLPETIEGYDVKDFSSEIIDGGIKYKLLYSFHPKNIKDIYNAVCEIIKAENVTEESYQVIKLSLLPTDMYEYSINVPGKGNVSYENISRFRYMLLAAERDEFSFSNNKIGSKSLVKLLQMKLNDKDKIEVEKKYSEFFETVKNLSGMDEILNWQSASDIANASEFIDSISILPNMPSMSSILNSVKLGYNDESLSFQGLGHRNMILLLVLMNALLDKSEEKSLMVLSIEEPEAHLCINNIKLVASFINAITADNKRIQTFCSTHSTEFINKLDLENIILMYNGQAHRLATAINAEERQYLSKNPNLDIYKLFMARRCVLVEGLTEELLIRAYLQSKKELSEIGVISFHKGYINIIEIWKKLNIGMNRKLAVIRDYDDQENAKQEHDKMANEQVCVSTTTTYTLEPEIVNAGDNYELLKNKYGERMGWNDMNPEELQNDWRNSKSFVMLQICQDLINGELDTFTMPEHINRALVFLSQNKELEQ